MRFPRLEAVFGVKLDSLTEGHLENAVEGGLEESQDLDFKRDAYGNTDSERRSLAVDAAALANANGGMLVIGVAEDDGRASALVPFELTEPEILRVERVIASNVFPFLEIRVMRVPVEGEHSLGYCVILVAPSYQRPHAVSVNNAYRYPVRSGRTNRYLSESEIASAYRDRFAAARDRLDRVDEVMDEGLNKIDHYELVWLVQACVPERAGSMELRHGTDLRIKEWLRELEDGPSDGRPQFLDIGAIESRTRRRRIALRIGRIYAEFHIDGATFLASPIGVVRTKVGQWSEDPVGVPIFDELLATQILAQLRVAAHHAVENANTFGDVMLRSQIVGAVTYEGSRLETSKILAHGRLRMGEVEAVRGCTPITGAETEATLSLQDIYAASSGWVSAGRVIMQDFVQSFGLAEPFQFTEAGEVRTKYFGGPAAWVSDLGLTASDEMLE